MNELTVNDQAQIEKEVIEYLDVIGTTTQLKPEEKKMFINIAKAFGLSPFKKEIHIIAYGEGPNRKCSIITGYEVYLKRAERTEKLDGWKHWIEGEGNNMKAVVEIWRKDRKFPFVHEAYFSEACQYNREGKPNAVWSKMSRFMCSKVAISQAFRLCFPDELGGMPLSEEELPIRDVTPTYNLPNVTPTKNPPMEEIISLAKQAGDEQPKTERGRILEATKNILETKNPDLLAYFNEAEKQAESSIAKYAKDTGELETQRARLEKELSKRISAYKPIPWEDTKTHSMFTEYEDDGVVTKEEGKVDDIF